MEKSGTKQLLVVYHSQSGTCAKMAQAAVSGAQHESGVEVQVRRAWDACVDDLASSQALLLVAAENSGALSGAMKDFLDRTFYPAIARGLVVPYALLISAGNDGAGAQRQVERIMKGYPFPAATQTLIHRGEFSREHALACEELGEALAAGLHMGIY